MEKEEELFQAFVVPRKRQHYVELLNTKRGREKIRLALDHFGDLDPRFCRRVTHAEHNPADILRLLKSLGAPSTCHLMSVDGQLDGREMVLSEALSEVIGRGQGTFISCVPGRLAYFEGEEANARYICHRQR